MKATLRKYKSTANPNLKWVVRHTSEGRVTRKFFKTKTAAEVHIGKLANLAEKAGADAAALAPADLRELLEARRVLAPYGVTVLEAAQAFAQAREAAGASKTIESAVEALLSARKREGKAKRTLGDLENRLTVFARHFGTETRLAAVTTEAADSWLAGLEVSAQTRNHYRRVAHSLFNFATKRGWTAANPFAYVEKATVRRKLPGIFTAAQIQTMLASTEDEQIRLFVAIGAFAGLRPESELCGLKWENIHLERGVIDLTGEEGKNARRRQVEIQRALLPILKQYARPGGVVVTPSFHTADRFKRWKAALPFKWPHDGLRHSFGTYHLQAFEDAGKTALQMGHGGNPAMLFRHYHRPGIDRKTALAFFGLKKAAAAKVVAFEGRAAQ